MAKSEKQLVFSTADESKTSLQLSSPEVTANQIFYTSPQNVKLTASCFIDAQRRCQSQYSGGQLNPELRSYSAPAAQHLELVRHTLPQHSGASFHHSPSGASRSYPAHIRSWEVGGEGGCRDFGLNLWSTGTTEPAAG